jgi:hypothetical protein
MMLVQRVIGISSPKSHGLPKPEANCANGLVETRDTMTGPPGRSFFPAANHGQITEPLTEAAPTLRRRGLPSSITRGATEPQHRSEATVSIRDEGFKRFARGLSRQMSRKTGIFPIYR